MKAKFRQMMTFAAVSILLAVPVVSKAAGPALKVTLENGATTVYPLSGGSTMHFSDGELVISDINLDVKIPLDNLLKWEYDVQPAGISDTEASNVIVSLEGDRLQVVGLYNGSSLSVYSVDGLSLYTATSDGNALEISTDAWPKGVYLVKHSGTVVKVVKR